MSDMISKLFPEGRRKLMMTLIGLVLSAVLDHFGKLDENMKTSIIAMVAIFAGGNVLEHFASALKFLKGTKVGQIIEDAIPGDQGLGQPDLTQIPQMINGIDAAHQKADGLSGQVADLERKLAVQAQNTAQIVQILNTMRGAAPAPAQPPRS